MTVPPPYSPFGISALEVAIVERMILRAHGEALVGGIGGRAARHRPAFQDAVHLQPQIEMLAPREMPLHDEPRAAARDAPPCGSGVLAKSRLAR